MYAATSDVSNLPIVPFKIPTLTRGARVHCNRQCLSEISRRVTLVGSPRRDMPRSVTNDIVPATNRFERV